MEILKEAHDFYIKNLYASDGGVNDLAAIALLDKLANAACLSAGHQSDERYDAPKCHPETRAAVIKDIMSWVNDKDSKEPIMWMSGPAGAGKSAIAQTVCEKCHNEKKLLASFFFSRTDTGPGRSEAKRLVPTIACQLAIAIPELKPMIIEKLNSDSAMLTYSMEKQMQQLILEPLTAMHIEVEQDGKSPIAEGGHTPYVVVIDGLDECNDPKDQTRIVRMISAICLTQVRMQLRFFIASRPELEIRNAFELIIDRRICAQIILNEDYSPDNDIRTYLRSELVALKREHTLRQYLQQDSDWPSSNDINNLVRASSGQFIYASTVMKYLRDQRRDPRNGLRAIQVNAHMTTAQINSPRNESPYTPLDSLYKRILATSSTGYDSCKIIFQILLFARHNMEDIFGQDFLSPTLDVLSSFTGMTLPDLELLLADFHSILYIPNKGRIKFYHASFEDFLKDTSRSDNFYISDIEAHKYIAQRCLSIILEISPESVQDELNEAQKYAVNRFFTHLEKSNLDEELLTVLRSQITLHAVLNVLTKYKHYDFLIDVIEFSFDGKRESDMESRPYWIPRTEKIQDICFAIVKFVEGRFLIKMHSVGTLNGYDVIQALCYTAGYWTPPPFKRYKDGIKWLKFLLENPLHGNCIYLDSENSFVLYKNLIQETDRSTRRHYGDGEETYYPFVLKYLLMKIQPAAAYMDSDLFPRASKEVLNEIIRGHKENDRSKLIHKAIGRMYEKDRPRLEQCIKDLHSVTETFLEQCRELKKQEEEEMKRKQEEDFRRQQEEELKHQQEEDFRRQQEEELKHQQEEQQTKRSFRNRLMSPIKNVQRKLKDK